MPYDMLDRLLLDPGRRTLGELIQERAWAAGEIQRLKRALQKAQERPKRGSGAELPPWRWAAEAPSPAAMLRIDKVVKLTGLSRSTIYSAIQDGRFPAGVKVGIRARRWRAAEIWAWQESGLRDQWLRIFGPRLLFALIVKVCGVAPGR